MVGLFGSRRAKPIGPALSTYACLPRSSIPFKLAPAENATSPAPVSTSTLAPLSAASLDRLPEGDRELGINAVVDFWSVERQQSHRPPVLNEQVRHELSLHRTMSQTWLKCGAPCTRPRFTTPQRGETRR